jgi:hypothetical protein
MVNSFEQDLRNWQAETEPTAVMVRTVKKLPSLQPRNAAACIRRDAELDAKQGEQQINRLVDWLQEHPSEEVEPVLLTEVDGKLYVVDGHHRLAAYKRTGRHTIPARVRQFPFKRAVHVAALANLTGEKRVLNSGQRLEAAWQWLAVVTQRGQRKLPKGATMRSVASMYGISKMSVQRMTERLPKARADRDARLFREDQMNAVTDWPMWKHARGQGDWQDRDASADEIHRRKVDQMAAKLATWIEREGAEVFRDACALLGQEAAAAAATVEEDD